MASLLSRLWPFSPRAASAPSPAPAMSSHTGAGSEPHLAAWNPYPGSADADLLPDLSTLMARSRDLSRNNGLMTGGMQTLRDNIVGSTLRLSALPDYRLLGWSREKAREWANDVEAQFRSWADTAECDAARTLNLLGLTLQMLGGAMLNGDAVALPLWLPRPGQAWATRLMIVEADRLCTPPEKRGAEDVRGGIRFGPHGDPLAYYILKKHPGDALLGKGMDYAEWEEIPAFTAWGRKRVIHLHDKERSGQSRGKPVVAGVMRELRMAGEYASNELKASVTNSLIAAFLESDQDTQSMAEMLGDGAAAFNAQIADSARAAFSRLRGPALITIPPGTRVNTVAPGRPNPAFDAFMKAALRHIAAGMNMPYELLLKDFSQTSYSSARAALLEAWRYFNGRRRWITDYFLRDVYDLWLEEAVNSGRVQAPGYYERRYAYARARFLFGGRGWVDPVKDAQAAEIRLRAGLSTLERECAEQGEDWEEVMDQQQTERQMLHERGLDFYGVTRQTATGKSIAPPDGPGVDEAEEPAKDTVA